MDEANFEAPGKGSWELDSTHFTRPIARFSGAIGSAPVFSSTVVRASYTIFSATLRLPLSITLLMSWVTSRLR